MFSEPKRQVMAAHCPSRLATCLKPKAFANIQSLFLLQPLCLCHHSGKTAFIPVHTWLHMAMTPTPDDSAVVLPFTPGTRLNATTPITDELQTFLSLLPPCVLGAGRMAYRAKSRDVQPAELFFAQLVDEMIEPFSFGHNLRQPCPPTPVYDIGLTEQDELDCDEEMGNLYRDSHSDDIADSDSEYFDQELLDDEGMPDYVDSDSMADDSEYESDDESLPRPPLFQDATDLWDDDHDLALPSNDDSDVEWPGECATLPNVGDGTALPEQPTLVALEQQFDALSLPEHDVQSSTTHDYCDLGNDVQNAPAQQTAAAPKAKQNRLFIRLPPLQSFQASPSHRINNAQSSALAAHDGDVEAADAHDYEQGSSSGATKRKGDTFATAWSPQHDDKQDNAKDVEVVAPKRKRVTFKEPVESESEWDDAEASEGDSENDDDADYFEAAAAPAPKRRRTNSKKAVAVRRRPAPKGQSSKPAGHDGEDKIGAKRVSCPLCTESIVKTHLKRHLASHDKARVSCPACAKQMLPRGLRKHLLGEGKVKRSCPASAGDREQAVAQLFGNKNR
ncbi:hypothetical protein R3P38DRAFT_3042952 [Favolaschia claudopus]|uniref:C2H2-type domain-containing protein n=1 Tax=Favolaschia claudopus TaxID=2862362 RepID=A0AAW0A8A1_9AGAR